MSFRYSGKFSIRSLQKSLPWLGMVAQACNPSYLGGSEDHSSSPGQVKFSKTPSQPVAVCGGTHLSSQPLRKHSRWIEDYAQAWMWDTTWKITRAKEGRGSLCYHFLCGEQEVFFSSPLLPIYPVILK
jgi:hypothetical protein